jgi:hypothetical protein
VPSNGPDSTAPSSTANIIEAVSPSKHSIQQDLEEMFARHPLLKARLRMIYEETKEPSEKPARNRQQRSEGRWTEEKGFEAGLKALKAKLESDLVDVSDLRAFADYVKVNNATADM